MTGKIMNNYKLSYFSDECIEIKLISNYLSVAIKKENISKEDIEFSIKIYKYIRNSIQEINNEA